MMDNPPQAPDSPATIVHALRLQAALNPQAIVLMQGQAQGQQITRYGDLGARAAAFSALLLSNALAPRSRVALLLDNSVDYVVAYFGALWAGAVVVPLSPWAKSPELINQLEHADAKWLIAASGQAAVPDIRRRFGQRLRILTLDEAFPSLASPRRDPGRDPSPDPRHRLAPTEDAMQTPIMAAASNWAVLMYTSGTTGRPKGVMLSHRNLISNALAINQYLQLDAADRTVCILPFHYAFGSSLLHTHVLAGASLVLVNAPAYPALWVEAIAEQAATGFSGVPAAYAILLSRVDLGVHDLSNLRYLSQAGGPMTAVMAERLRSAVPQAQLFIMYGQTEATARLSYLPPERWPDKKGSVGIPISGVRLEIRNQAGRLLPSGRVGEVWARGPNLMLGYWQEAAMTRSVLRNGWLRTGDLGVMDGEGFLFLRGRAIELIKTAAYRVSPEEIEEVIAEIVGVDEVAVVGVADDMLGQAIRAVIVTQPLASVTKRDVIRHCSRVLPRFKVPKEIIFAKGLPRTASGKVRRSLLAHDCRQTQLAWITS